MRLRYWTGSLKLRLALASVALIALSVALTLVLVLNDLEQRRLEATLDGEASQAEHYAGLLSSRLVGLQRDLGAAATQLPMATDEAALVGYLRQQVVLRNIFDNTYVLDLGGHILAMGDATAVHAGRDYSSVTFSDRDYFRQTLERRRGVISEPILSRFSKAPTIVFTMPVFDRDGRLLAILCASFNLLLHPLVTDVTRAPLDARDPVQTIVTDAHGRIVSHIDAARIFTPASADPRFATAVARWNEQRQPIDPQGAAYKVGATLIAFAGVPDADWMVFRSAPAEIVLGGPAAGRIQAVYIGASVAVAGGIVVLLTLLFLLRPLRQLEARALALLDTTLSSSEGWPRCGGELGELARVFHRVMRQRASMQHTSQALLSKMQAVLVNAPVGIAFTQTERVELVSAKCETLLGYAPGALLGRSTQEIFESAAAHAHLIDLAKQAFLAGRAMDEELELRRADGTAFWARLHGAPVQPGHPRTGWVWTFIDVTETRRHRERLSWSATHDSLTGLVNRVEFEHRLAPLLEDVGAEPSVALFLDLDRFKVVNDTGGHAAGDEVLRGIGLVLADRARARDTVARVGGDEFALLLRGCDAIAAERVGRELCARVQAFRLERGGRIHSVGASIGVVAVDRRFSTVDQVIAAADAACYEAKRAGRNGVRVYTADAVPSGGVEGRPAASVPGR